jgi:hypothetical protein
LDSFIGKKDNLEDYFSEFSDDELEFIATALKAAGKEALIRTDGAQFDYMRTDENALRIMN